MPRYWKKVIESSSAIVAIDAPDKNTADKVFRDFYENGCEDYGISYDDFRIHMNSSFEDHISDLCETPWDADNPDFLLTAPVQKEPKYDLYIRPINNSDMKNDGRRRAYFDRDMESVLSILQEFNKDYILKSTIAVDYGIYKDARERGVTVLYYSAERRIK